MGPDMPSATAVIYLFSLNSALPSPNPMAAYFSGTSAKPAAAGLEQSCLMLLHNKESKRSGRRSRCKAA